MQFAGTLPRDFAAPVCIVLHIPPDAPSLLAQIISRDSLLPAVHAEHMQKWENGTIYVLPYSRAGVRETVKHVKETGTNDMVGYHGDDPGVPVIVTVFVAVAAILIIAARAPTGDIVDWQTPRPDWRRWARGTTREGGGNVD